METSGFNLDEFPRESVMFTPVHVFQRILSFPSSKLHQATEGALLWLHSAGVT